MDVFQQDWSYLAGFVNPPWYLMGRAPSEVTEQKAQIIPVAPIWKGQPWYSVLVSMLWEFL